MYHGKKIHLHERTFFLSSLSLSLANSNPNHGHPTMSVSASHLYYTCPEGANATLVCNQRGAALHPNDSLRHLWFYTPHKEQHCTSQHGPRNITLKHTKLPPGVHFGATQENFWVQLQHVTHADQGRYCCAALELENTHHSAVQRTHSHMFLKITPSKSIQCVGFSLVGGDNYGLFGLKIYSGSFTGFNKT